MKRFVASWYNYIAQETQTEYIEAENEYEARQTMILYMDNQHPHHKHNNDSIECIYEDGYIESINFKDEMAKRKANPRLADVEPDFSNMEDYLDEDDD